MANCLKEISDEKKAHIIQTNIKVGKILEKVAKKLNLTTISELRAINNFSSVCQVLLEEEIGDYPFIVWNEVVSYIFEGINGIEDMGQEAKILKKVVSYHNKISSTKENK